MITELVGFTLSRAIPEKCLFGLATGALQLCGGVIRNNSGQIVAHLVNTSSPLGLANQVGSMALGGLNTYQLHKIGKGVGEIRDNLAALQAATSQLAHVAQGTMLLSGLTLAVSAAGFLFLAKRLDHVDQKLNEIAKDVKAIKAFLQTQEKAALTTALHTLAGIKPGLDDKTRIPLLIGARQTLGEIHQRYREQLSRVERIEDVFGIEEYFAVTALGHAMCSAELDMHGNAVADLDAASSIWRAAARRICSDLVMGPNPERLLSANFADEVKTEEITAWLDFAHGTDKGIEWVDELRRSSTFFRLPQVRVSDTEKRGLQLMRKLVARDRIFEGYTLQYRYLEQHALRPSEVQQYFDSLDAGARVEDCFILVANHALDAKATAAVQPAAAATA